MKINMQDYQTLIDEIKRDVVPGRSPGIANMDPMRVTLADSYEIRNLDKAMVKKLKEEEIMSLVAYGENYIEQFKEGKFLYKKGPGRYPQADFDEVESYNDIVKSVSLLKDELNHKG